MHSKKSQNSFNCVKNLKQRGHNIVLKKKKKICDKNIIINHYLNNLFVCSALYGVGFNLI